MIAQIVFLAMACFWIGVESFSATEWQIAIDDSCASWMEAFDNRDIPAMMALYTDDCLNLPPGRPLIPNKRDFEAILTSIKSSGSWLDEDTNLALDDLVFSSELDAVATLKIESTGFDGKIKIGKAVRVFRQIDGEARIALSIWNFHDVK